MNSQKFIAELQKQLGEGLTARPFNRFEPGNSIWWLVPSAEWPAFQYSKIFVNPLSGTNKYEVGLYLEKGHSSNILLVEGNKPSNRAQVMDNDWEWAKLSKDKGRLEDVIISMQQAGVSPRVRLEIEPFSPERAAENYDGEKQKIRLTYDYTGTAINLLDKIDTINDPKLRGLIEDVAQQTNVAGVVNSIELFSESEWYWMNLLIHFETDSVNASVGVLTDMLNLLGVEEA